MKVCNCALPSLTGGTKCCENCPNNKPEINEFDDTISRINSIGSNQEELEELRKSKEGNEKIDMFSPNQTLPNEDVEFKMFCSKCSRYEKCRRMDPACEHSVVWYC